jgi:uncharacterized membrane protein
LSRLSARFLSGSEPCWRWFVFFKVVASPSIRGYESTRLLLARFLSLGLEFQLAADILGTAVAPSWAQIGKLAAVAVIRTGLNYFLAREIKEEQEAVQSELA